MSFHFMIVVDSSQKKYSFISLCLKPEMWQRVAKFKGAEYFRKALCIYIYTDLTKCLIQEIICCPSPRVHQAVYYPQAYLIP